MMIRPVSVVIYTFSIQMMAAVPKIQIGLLYIGFLSGSANDSFLRCEYFCIFIPMLLIVVAARLMVTPRRKNKLILNS